MNTNSNDILNSDFGYGILPKKVMRDRNLNIQAKALFAYLCVYAGNKDTCYPSISLITADLRISKDTYYKYIKQLKDFGYITSSQVRSDKGVFRHTIYKLIAHPTTPSPKISDTDTPSPNLPDTVQPDTDLPDTVQPDTDLPDTVQPDTDKKETKNHMFKNNSIKINTLNINMIDDKDEMIIIKKYNSVSDNKIKELNDEQKVYMSVIFEKHGLKGFLDSIQQISNSEWLKANMDFEWYCDIENFEKVLKGGYRDFKSVNKNNESSNNNLANLNKTKEYTGDELKSKMLNKNKKSSCTQQEDDISTQASDALSRILGNR